MRLDLYIGERLSLELADVVLHDSGAAASGFVINGAWNLASDGADYWCVERPTSRWPVEGTSLRSPINDPNA